MEVKCGNCGAAFNVPDTARLVVCPYCGAVLERKSYSSEFELVRGHFYYPVSQHDPYPLLIDFLSNNAPVPKDFASTADLRERRLYYIPVYIYHVQGETTIYRYNEPLTTYKYSEYVSVPAIDIGMVSKLLAPWHIAVEGKKPFDPSIKEMGEYYDPVLHPLDVSWMAELVYKWWAYIKTRRTLGMLYWCDTGVSNTVFTNIVHYPIWWIKYYYNGRFYEAYVDGVDNRVILAEYPRRLTSDLSIILYSILLALMTGYFTYSFFQQIPFLEHMRFSIAFTVSIFSMIPSIMVLKRLRYRGLVSSMWFEDEIVNMLDIFIYFPY